MDNAPVQRLLDEVSATVAKLYRETVDPLQARFAFESRPSTGEVSGAPMVLLLGNHSSGKSTFINYLLGTDVQKTGLAPTDDAFTVLSWERSEEEREGQAVNAFGGFKVQGRSDSGTPVRDAACAIQDAGAFSIVIELVPAELARSITTSIEIPTIGIGAGPFCDGEVQVYNDLVGLSTEVFRHTSLR